jgi:signal transduction histidine kinase
MVRARCGAAAAVLSAAVAVAVAVAMIGRPSTQTLFFAPAPFTADSFVAASSAVGLVWAVTGLVLVWVRPRNALGWLILGAGVSHCWAVGLTAYGGWSLQQALLSWPAYVGPALYLPGWLIPPTLLLALYPDGRLPSPRWRWPVGGAAVSIVLLTVSVPFPVVGPDQAFGWAMVPKFPDRLGDLLLPSSDIYDVYNFVLAGPTADRVVVPAWWSEWTGFAVTVFKPLLVLSLLLIWGGTVVRLHRARPPRRQQLAWVVLAVMPLLAASLFAPVEFANVLVFASLLLAPVGVAVGVLRYRLLGIETVLRRGLVYGMFTAAVVLAYLLAAATVGAALDSHWVPGAVAAAVAAVGLAPARDRLQRAADRLVYGSRLDPLEAVTQFGIRVTTGGELDLLPGALASVVAAVHAPGASVTGPDERVLATLGAPTGHTTVVPLAFGGKQLGELRVAPRRPGEPYGRADTRLLSALALQVAVVVRAVGLTEALEAERDRVLAATTTERDRLRGDLHDGLGPSLSGVGLGLHALADRLEGGDREASTVLLDRLRDEVALAVSEVRRIIDGLRPTALDTLGLPDAIRRHAETVSSAVPVRVDAADLPALPPGVENAAYRITTEALTNAARHAEARQVRVTLTVPDGALEITVSDDGRGVGTATAGVGLTSMRRRAEVLGGRLGIDSADDGTTITASLPLEPV